MMSFTKRFYQKQRRTALFHDKSEDLVFAKSTHDNPLRKLQRDMAELAIRQVQWARHLKVIDRHVGNPVRREKKAIRRELGLTTGRAWRRWLKAATRAERARALS
jgi:hypothetical protein